jgi:hypothetical protein
VPRPPLPKAWLGWPPRPQEVQADAQADTANPDRTLSEQLTFLQKVSSDLGRVTEALVA